MRLLNLLTPMTPCTVKVIRSDSPILSETETLSFNPAFHALHRMESLSVGLHAENRTRVNSGADKFPKPEPRLNAPEKLSQRVL